MCYLIGLTNYQKPNEPQPLCTIRGTWMANDGDGKAWNLANWIIIAMAGVIGALVVAGYNNLSSKTDTGFASIYAEIRSLQGSVSAVNAEMKQMGKDLTRI